MKVLLSFVIAILTLDGVYADKEGRNFQLLKYLLFALFIACGKFQVEVSGSIIILLLDVLKTLPHYRLQDQGDTRVSEVRLSRG